MGRACDCCGVNCTNFEYDFSVDRYHANFYSIERERRDDVIQIWTTNEKGHPVEMVHTESSHAGTDTKIGKAKEAIRAVEVFYKGRDEDVVADEDFLSRYPSVSDHLENTYQKTFEVWRYQKVDYQQRVIIEFDCSDINDTSKDLYTYASLRLGNKGSQTQGTFENNYSYKIDFISYQDVSITNDDTNVKIDGFFDFSEKPKPRSIEDLDTLISSSSFSKTYLITDRTIDFDEELNSVDITDQEFKIGSSVAFILSPPNLEEAEMFDDKGYVQSNNNFNSYYKADWRSGASRTGVYFTLLEFIRPPFSGMEEYNNEKGYKSNYYVSRPWRIDQIIKGTKDDLILSRDWHNGWVRTDDMWTFESKSDFLNYSTNLVNVAFNEFGLGTYTTDRFEDKIVSRGSSGFNNDAWAKDLQFSLKIFKPASGNKKSQIEQVYADLTYYINHFEDRYEINKCQLDTSGVTDSCYADNQTCIDWQTGESEEFSYGDGFILSAGVTENFSSDLISLYKDDKKIKYSRRTFYGVLDLYENYSLNFINSVDGKEYHGDIKSNYGYGDQGSTWWNEKIFKDIVITDCYLALTSACNWGEGLAYEGLNNTNAVNALDNYPSSRINFHPLNNVFQQRRSFGLREAKAAGYPFLYPATSHLGIFYTDDLPGGLFSELYWGHPVLGEWNAGVDKEWLFYLGHDSNSTPYSVFKNAEMLPEIIERDEQVFLSQPIESPHIKISFKNTRRKFPHNIVYFNDAKPECANFCIGTGRIPNWDIIEQNFVDDLKPKALVDRYNCKNVFKSENSEILYSWKWENHVSNSYNRYKSGSEASWWFVSRRNALNHRKLPTSVWDLATAPTCSHRQCDRFNQYLGQVIPGTKYNILPMKGYGDFYTVAAYQNLCAQDYANFIGSRTSGWEYINNKCLDVIVPAGFYNLDFFSTVQASYARVLKDTFKEEKREIGWQKKIEIKENTAFMLSDLEKAASEFSEYKINASFASLARTDVILGTGEEWNYTEKTTTKEKEDVFVVGEGLRFRLKDRPTYKENETIYEWEPLYQEFVPLYYRAIRDDEIQEISDYISGNFDYWYQIEGEYFIPDKNGKERQGELAGYYVTDPFYKISATGEKEGPFTSHSLKESPQDYVVEVITLLELDKTAFHRIDTLEDPEGTLPLLIESYSLTQDEILRANINAFGEITSWNATSAGVYIEVDGSAGDGYVQTDTPARSARVGNPEDTSFFGFGVETREDKFQPTVGRQPIKQGDLSRCTPRSECYGDPPYDPSIKYRSHYDTFINPFSDPQIINSSSSVQIPGTTGPCKDTLSCDDPEGKPFVRYSYTEGEVDGCPITKNGKTCDGTTVTVSYSSWDIAEQSSSELAYTSTSDGGYAKKTEYFALMDMTGLIGPYAIKHRKIVPRSEINCNSLPTLSFGSEDGVYLNRDKHTVTIGQSLYEVHYYYSNFELVGAAFEPPQKEKCGKTKDGGDVYILPRDPYIKYDISGRAIRAEQYRYAENCPPIPAPYTESSWKSYYCDPEIINNNVFGADGQDECRYLDESILSRFGGIVNNSFWDSLPQNAAFVYGFSTYREWYADQISRTGGFNQDSFRYPCAGGDERWGIDKQGDFDVAYASSHSTTERAEYVVGAGYLEGPSIDFQKISLSQPEDFQDYECPTAPLAQPGIILNKRELRNIYEDYTFTIGMKNEEV